jgi:hypothetical protein
MKILLIALTLMSFISCEEVKLGSCDLTVYHKGNIEGYVLDDIRNEVYYDKGWNVNYLEFRNQQEVDRSLQHAILTYSEADEIIGQKQVGKNHGFFTDTIYTRFFKRRRNCAANIMVSLPELGQSFNKNVMNSEETAYSNTSYVHNKALRGFCEKNAMKIVKEIPKCEIK